MSRIFKFTIKSPEQRHWRSSAVCIVNFEHIFFSASIADFGQVIVCWICYFLY